MKSFILLIQGRENPDPPAPKYQGGSVGGTPAFERLFAGRSLCHLTWSFLRCLELLLWALASDMAQGNTHPVLAWCQFQMGSWQLTSVEQAPLVAWVTPLFSQTPGFHLSPCGRASAFNGKGKLLRCFIFGWMKEADLDHKEVHRRLKWVQREHHLETTLSFFFP